MDPLGDWALAFVGALVRGGVRLAVVSPGSRSTPLAWAVHKLASSDLRVVSALDEREGAFFGLGFARAQGAPAMLVCTSGSAPAHYHPAVVEAFEAYLPMIVVSADRPLELLGSGANQTTDQMHLFGSHVRDFRDLEAPSEGGGAIPIPMMERIVEEVTERALRPIPGPIHLNVRFRKPLEPSDQTQPKSKLQVTPQNAEAPRVSTVQLKGTGNDNRDIASLRELLRQRQRGVVVAGPWSPSLETGARGDAVGDYRKVVSAVCQAFGLPLLAESTSQLRFTTDPAMDGTMRPLAFDALLRSEVVTKTLAVDFVLQLGTLPVSGGFERFMTRSAKGSGVSHAAIHPFCPANPWRFSGSVCVRQPVTSSLRTLLEMSPENRTDPAFLDAWKRFGTLAEGCVSRLSATAGPDSPLNEGRALQQLFAALPGGTHVTLGNSLPIRSVDRWVLETGKELNVVCQRGVSGIDGLISGTLGAAFSQQAVVAAAPVVLVLGDVSALHGLSGLLLAEQLLSEPAVPVVVVVLNNGGGRIFEQLPVKNLNAFDDTSLWRTAHDRTFEHAAAFFQVGYQHASTESELKTGLAAALATPAVSLVEVAVPPHDMTSRDARLNQQVDEL